MHPESIPADQYRYLAKAAEELEGYWVEIQAREGELWLGYVLLPGQVGIVVTGEFTEMGPLYRRAEEIQQAREAERSESF